MFGLVLYDEMRHKTSMITFKLLVLDDPQMLYLCCITQKDVIYTQWSSQCSERFRRHTYQHIHPRWVFKNHSVSQRVGRAGAGGWLSVLLMGARPTVHHLQILINAPASLWLRHQIPIINSEKDRLVESAEVFICPLASIETFSNSSRQTVSHNKQWGPFYWGSSTPHYLHTSIC